jgi:hypothetical protein
MSAAIHQATYGRRIVLVDCRCPECEEVVGQVVRTTAGMLYAGREDTWGRERTAIDAKDLLGEHAPRVTAHQWILFEQEPRQLPRGYCDEHGMTATTMDELIAATEMAQKRIRRSHYMKVVGKRHAHP